MVRESDNCTVCAEEYPLDELKSIALSAVHVTRFKICNNCLNKSDPQDDYFEVRNIVNSYLKLDKSDK